MANPAWTVRADAIERAENLIALAIDLCETVFFIGQRGGVAASDEEIVRILIVASKLKEIAHAMRKEA
jgi:hypothetical protein